MPIESAHPAAAPVAARTSAATPTDATPTVLVAVVADALDPDRLAAFWAAALGWRRTGTAVLPALPDTPGLLFVPTGVPKTTKNRLHLDLGTGGPGQHEAGLDRLRDLGAVPADIGQGDVPWTVLADPEGNEFCVFAEPAPDGALVAVCQDAADLAAQSPFWLAATGWAVAAERDTAVSLRVPDGSGSFLGPRLVMGPPAVPKAGVNRWRLAVGPTGAGAGVRRPLTSADVGTVLRDPEGNEYHRLAASGAH